MIVLRNGSVGWMISICGSRDGVFERAWIDRCWNWWKLEPMSDRVVYEDHDTAVGMYDELFAILPVPCMASHRLCAASLSRHQFPARGAWSMAKGRTMSATVKMQRYLRCFEDVHAACKLPTEELRAAIGHRVGTVRCPSLFDSPSCRLCLFGVYQSGSLEGCAHL
jgi:hypothetical protein